MAPVMFDVRCPSEQRFCGCGSEANEHTRFDEIELCLQPPVAGSYLLAVGSLVDTSLAAAAVLEVLDRIGHIHLGTVDSGLRKRTVKQCAGGPHEWSALTILAVAGLLTYEHHRCSRRALPEDGLSRVAPQRTGTTFPRLPPQLVECLLCACLRRH